MAWLRSGGFTVEYQARGRNWIAFSGAAGQVQTAFHTQIHRYRVAGKMHFANATEPSIPAALEPVVLAVQGLDDFGPESSPRRPPAPLDNPDYTSSSGIHSLTPGDIATIYDLNPLYSRGIDGSGQTIAVIGQTEIDLSDIETLPQQVRPSRQ